MNKFLITLACLPLAAPLGQKAVMAIHHGHHLIGHWTKARVALHNAH